MKIDIPIDPADIPTAQEKGVRVVRGTPMFYKKPEMQRFEKRLESILAPHYRKFRITDGKPCFVHISYLFAYPKSTPKRDRVDMARMSRRPDGDNLSKAIIDALGDRFVKDKMTGRFFVSRRGFFSDDAQIATLVISKFRTVNDPKVVVVIREYEEGVDQPLSNPK